MKRALQAGRSPIPLRARARGAAGALAAVLALATPSLAQIGQRMVDEPWKDAPHWADTVDELFFFERADVEDAPDSARLFFWASRGRIKPERDSTDPLFALGYRIITMDASATDPRIDGALNDVAVSAMGCLGEPIEGWKLRLIAGMGTANDGHWRDADALYGTATADFETGIDEASSLHVGVAWDGNSGLFPDFPLPYVAYATRPSENLDVLVGTRDAAIRWKPAESLELKLDYAFPVDAGAEIGWTVAAGVGLFARYERSLSGYRIDGEDRRRIFYSQDVVVAGIRWVTYWFDLSVGPGWAIDRDFERGFDARDLDAVAELRSGPFAFLRVQGTF
ncbi:MAG: hypothetical protein ACUVYA_04035 [Planctomycetota bacterium]